jgi:hypothetical protein
MGIGIVVSEPAEDAFDLIFARLFPGEAVEEKDLEEGKVEWVPG